MRLVEVVAHGILPCLSTSTGVLLPTVHSGSGKVHALYTGLFHEEGQAANDMASPFGQVG